jgi:hypothetical protein
MDESSPALELTAIIGPSYPSMSYAAEVLRLAGMAAAAPSAWQRSLWMIVVGVVIVLWRGLRGKISNA